MVSGTALEKSNLSLPSDSGRGEERAFELKYFVESQAEAYERNVIECQLSSDVRPETELATTKLGLPYETACPAHQPLDHAH
jgi:hypothetical protein